MPINQPQCSTSSLLAIHWKLLIANGDSYILGMTFDSRQFRLTVWPHPTFLEPASVVHIEAGNRPDLIGTQMKREMSEMALIRWANREIAEFFNQTSRRGQAAKAHPQAHRHC